MSVCLLGWPGFAGGGRWGFPWLPWVAGVRGLVGLLQVSVCGMGGAGVDGWGPLVSPCVVSLWRLRRFSWLCVCPGRGVCCLEFRVVYLGLCVLGLGGFWTSCGVCGCVLWWGLRRRGWRRPVGGGPPGRLRRVSWHRLAHIHLRCFQLSLRESAIFQLWPRELTPNCRSDAVNSASVNDGGGRPPGTGRFRRLRAMVPAA